MKMKQIADRLGKHDNTIRKYAQLFAEFLSPAPSKGEHRIFTDDDMRVIGFISKLSDTGMKHDEIYQAVKRKLDEGTPFPPVLPVLSPADKQGLITLPEMDAQLSAKDAALREMEGRLAELRSQIERQNQKEVGYVDQISRLNQEIGGLKAELKALRNDK